MYKTTKQELVTEMEKFGKMQAKLTAQFFDTDTIKRSDYIRGIAIINESAANYLANWEEA